MNTSQLYEKTRRTYGQIAQIIKAIEEFAEYADAVNMYEYGKGSLANVQEELADVEIVCEQMALCFGVSPHTQALKCEYSLAVYLPKLQKVMLHYLDDGKADIEAVRTTLSMTLLAVTIKKNLIGKDAVNDFRQAKLARLAKRVGYSDDDNQ